MCFQCKMIEGVAVGCGWQAFVAYVNVGCYYVVGIPLGALLGFKFNLGAKVHLYFVLENRSLRCNKITKTIPRLKRFSMLHIYNNLFHLNLKRM